MVFASIAIFLRARAAIKNLLASSEHFLYFPLAAIRMEILFFKIKKENSLKRGLHFERKTLRELRLT